MQALIEVIAGFVAMLVAVALSQFGMNVDVPNKPEREIRRVQDCGDQRASNVVVLAESPQRSC